jgi:hypothetical protein
MFHAMKRLVSISLLLGLTGSAAAQPAMPGVGSELPPNGAEGWPAMQWLYDAPQMTDAAGKVVIHWFCAPKVAACVDDLARVTTLKENSTRVYVIAHVNGTVRDAKKLDPIRGSEGVGRGTLAHGKGVATLVKQLGLTAPTSFVVDVTGKVAHVATGGDPATLDARDAKVGELVAAIKEHTSTTDGPKEVAAGQKFTLSMTIKLSPWLLYSKKPGTTLAFRLTAPKEITCDRTQLGRDQLRPQGQTLTASVTCSGTKGSYEVRGQLDFSYDTPSGATGLGTDGAKWKFVIK